MKTAVVSVLASKRYQSATLAYAYLGNLDVTNIGEEGLHLSAHVPRQLLKVEQVHLQL
jgi:hypothetical protein